MNNLNNLGDYHKITKIAKSVGGPRNLLLITALAGSMATLGVGSVIYFIKKKTKVNKMSQIEVKKTISSEKEVRKYRTLLKDQSNEGVVFNVGDEFEVLAEDGDVILIDKKNDKNSPYYVSRDFLGKISSYKNN